MCVFFSWGDRGIKDNACWVGELKGRSNRFAEQALSG